MASLKNTAIAASLAALSLTGAWTLVDTFEGNKTTLYRDPLGIPTICKGTTSGPLIAKGKATQDECDLATLDDLKVALATVERCYKGPLTPGEKTAWVSFAYNVGPGGKGVKDGFCMLKSGNTPSHLRYLRNGEPLKACDMLFSWTQPGTNIHNGILRRRTAEYKACVADLP